MVRLTGRTGVAARGRGELRWQAVLGRHLMGLARSSRKNASRGGVPTDFSLKRTQLAKIPSNLGPTHIQRHMHPRETRQPQTYALA
jgi:hypothetical protein